jgi:Tol biopolymer transport system component
MITNPYIAGNPVTGSAMFFGRSDVFEFVRTNLIGRHQDNILVLHGQRRTGKTSVLYQMHRFIDRSYIPILVDVQGMTIKGMGGLLWELATTIQRGLRRPNNIRLPRPVRQDYQADGRHQFQQVFLAQVQQAIGDRRLLLMFDESELLYDKVRAGDLETDVFRYLSSLMQHYSFLAFLFTVGAKLEQMQGAFASLFRVALYKEITFLDDAATAELITGPVRGHYAYAPPAVAKIARLASGHPYYTQLICHELFTRQRQTGFGTATGEDVDAVLPQVLETSTSNLRYTWEQGDGAEKAVMAVLKDQIADDQPDSRLNRAALDAALDACAIPIPSGEVARALQDLSLRDVITDEAPYGFRVDLLRQWLRQNAPMSWVKQEIRNDIAAWQRGRRAPAPRRGWAIGLIVAVLVLIGAGIGVARFVIRPATQGTAATRTVEAIELAQREATAEALAALQQDPGVRASATAERARLEAILSTQTAQVEAGLAATAAMHTASAQAIETATIASIQTATAQPTATGTPTPTAVATATPTFTVTPTPTTTAMPTAAPTPTTVATAVPTSTGAPPVAPTTPPPATAGRIAFIAGNEVYTSNPDGSGQQRLTFNGAVESHPAWSPDGRRIAVYSDRTGNGEIFGMNADGSGAIQITDHPAPDLYPCWSPDGTRIAFVSERDNTRELYVVGAGGGEAQRLTHNNVDEAYPAWSPDGMVIAVAGQQSGQGGMWTVRADGSNGDNPTQINGIPGTFADLTWHGGRIYFAAAHTEHGSDWNIYSVLPDGGGWSFHATGPGDDRSPSWSPSGAQMVFTNSGNLYLTPPGPFLLFEQVSDPDWSRR